MNRVRVREAREMRYTAPVAFTPFLPKQIKRNRIETESVNRKREERRKTHEERKEGADGGDLKEGGQQGEEKEKNEEPAGKEEREKGGRIVFEKRRKQQTD